MRIRAGFEIEYECPSPSPMMLMLSLRPEREADLLTPAELSVGPAVPFHQYIDGFGNRCTRLVAPTGPITFSSDFIVQDSGEPDVQTSDAQQHAIEDLPDQTLVYLLGSRYCETDRLSDLAWRLFGNGPTGWGRVQLSSIMPTSASPLAISTRDRPGPLTMRTRSGWASAATSPTWRSRSAAA